MIGILAALTLLQAHDAASARETLEAQAGMADQAAQAAVESVSGDVRTAAMARFKAALDALLMPGRPDRATEVYGVAQLSRSLGRQIPVEQRTEEVTALLIAVGVNEEEACEGTPLEGANR